MPSRHCNKRTTRCPKGYRVNTCTGGCTKVTRKRKCAKSKRRSHTGSGECVNRRSKCADGFRRQLCPPFDCIPTELWESDPFACNLQMGMKFDMSGNVIPIKDE